MRWRIAIRALVVASIISFCLSTARANSVDASVLINNAIGCNVTYSCTNLTSLIFGFNSPTIGNGVLHFTNNSGVNWTTLTLTESVEPAIDITCTSNLFSCQVVPFGAHGAKIVLTASGQLGGVLNGKSFELGFGCRHDCLPWPDTHFSGVANLVTPEPGTVVLVVTGLCLTLFAGFARKNRLPIATFPEIVWYL